MNDITVTLFADAAHRRQVVELWETVFGYEAAHNDPKLVIEKKLEASDELFFVALAGQGCVKINLQILEENEGVSAFYASCGYVIKKCISMGKRIAENILRTRPPRDLTSNAPDF
jgi:hypothetical protein